MVQPYKLSQTNANSASSIQTNARLMHIIIRPAGMVGPHCCSDGAS